ncbi:hypothetical protein ACIRL2_29035 [Embleya sp. NPDC127516]|uniref:hypothetical protein n=1 Tax=Embleya sp. NPDC127516 TaxID=3363990 RepID=UPI0037F5B9CA
MSTDIAPATWVVGDWATARMPDGTRDRGQVVAMRHDGVQWLADVVPAADGADCVTVPADELWPDA